MLEALKKLMESGLIQESTRDAIETAWDAKVKEVQEQVRTEVREEFAGRYEHDKDAMIKALDKMASESLSEEIAHVKAERNDAAKYKIQAVKEAKGAAVKFEKFATHALAEELAELAQERKVNKEHEVKLENFIMTSLAEEINEFAKDKQVLRETRVKLISGAKEEFQKLKEKFVARSSKVLSEVVSQTLNHEISQLHEDIKVARQNNFGRKLFEAFATEYADTYLNENAAFQQIKAEKEAIENKLMESRKSLSDKEKLVESKSKDLRILTNRMNRTKIMNELLDPLDKKKREVMVSLLEDVQTNNLRTVYENYLPSVLDNKQVTKNVKPVLTEVTGDNKKIVPIDETDLTEIKRLAGIQ
ncbi:Uncharacterised protein [uncultured archaeon]|nr:Uncharacterised protein [uncultured archaeon]